MALWLNASNESFCAGQASMRLFGLYTAVTWQPAQTAMLRAFAAIFWDLVSNALHLAGTLRASLALLGILAAGGAARARSELDCRGKRNLLLRSPKASRKAASSPMCWLMTRPMNH